MRKQVCEYDMSQAAALVSYDLQRTNCHHQPPRAQTRRCPLMLMKCRNNLDLPVRGETPTYLLDVSRVKTAGCRLSQLNCRRAALSIGTSRTLECLFVVH